MSKQLLHTASRGRDGASTSSSSSDMRASYESDSSCESPVNRSAGHGIKRKQISSSSKSSHTSQLQFPLLADEEPSLHSLSHYQPHAFSFICQSDLVHQPASSKPFFCVSKHLFSLNDESRDRGSAKIASITVQLKHPAFQSASSSSSSRSIPSNSRSYLSCFKVDGRKSFSNAPFKRYYTRGIHAVWFADLAHTVLSPSSSAPSNGRVMMFLSQRSGRPNGKGFTGLRHDPSELSPKHPLVCLASNSVEYYVSVFINRSTEVFTGEDESSGDLNWQEVEVNVSAQFEAGQVSLEQVSIPSANNNSARIHTSAAASSNQPRQFVHISRRPALTVDQFAPRPQHKQIPSSISLQSLSSMEVATFKNSPTTTASSVSPVSTQVSSDDTSSPMEEDDENDDEEENCEEVEEEEEVEASGAATVQMEYHPDILGNLRQQSGVPTSTPNLSENGLNSAEEWQYPVVEEQSIEQQPILSSPVHHAHIKVNEDVMPPLRLLDEPQQQSPIDDGSYTPSKRQKLTIEHTTLNGISLIAHTSASFASSASPLFPLSSSIAYNWNAASPLMNFASSASPLMNDNSLPQFPSHFSSTF